MSRTYVATFALLTTAVVGLGSVVWYAARAKEPRFRPSRLLTDTFMDVLCRPPSDAETLKWYDRAADKDALVQALAATDEARGLAQLRQSYSEALRRATTREDCTYLRTWLERRLDNDAVRRELSDLPETRRLSAIRQLFIELFGRDPRGWDDPGLRRWVDSPYGIAEIRSRLRAQRPLVGVHYFAWYQSDADGWRNHATRVPAGAPKPALGWYNSADASVVAAHIRQMEDTGFDFVAVHAIPALPQTWSNAHMFFDQLSTHRLKAVLVLDSLYDEPAAVKAHWVERAKVEFGGNRRYLRLHGEPLVMLFSTHIDFDAPGALVRNVYWTYRYDPGSNTFNGDRRLEPRDWAFWAPTPQPLTNGMVPVIPGYSDVALGRSQSMVHERNNGEMYRQQWQRALALHPEVILVYSWNEYFERTAIEATDAWGDQYLRMTTCFIEHAHRGTTGTC